LPHCSPRRPCRTLHKCGHTQIAYNSCRNRHCPKCQGTAAREWLAEREKELLPGAYFHIVFSLPAEIAEIAYQNKAVIYDILFKASAEAMTTIAADPKQLGARIGILSVLHTWGSALTHHPHVHMIVPGGGISLDGTRWIACRPNFFLSVRVLSRLFRRLVLEKLDAAYHADKLQFFGQYASLTNGQSFATISLRCAKRNGSSTVNAHLEAPRKCCAISRAIPIVSPSQIAA
jgi:Putative transposase/Transposase zinc-binding domain